MTRYYCAAERCNSDDKKLKKYAYMQNVKFFPFPTKLKAPRQRKIWVDLLRRKNYDPPKHHRVCSLHFVDGCPTETNPFPTLFAYNNFKNANKPRMTNSIEKRSKSATDLCECTPMNTTCPEPVMPLVSLPLF